MALLHTQPNFGIPGEAPLRAFTPGDDFYQMLIDAHRGLDDEHSRLLNARLILLLANHIGDLRVLREAIDAARRGIAPVTPIAPVAPEEQA
jgi:Protein of unknown function (DUF2783)